MIYGKVWLILHIKCISKQGEKGKNDKYKHTVCPCHSVIITFAGQQFMFKSLNRGKNISSIFTSSTVSACVLRTLQPLQLNSKEELKVNDRLPAEITIHHLHLILHHV